MTPEQKAYYRSQSTTFRPSTRMEPTGDCPVCHGSGWELYETSDGTEAIYGEPVMLTYAKKCSRCQGFTQADIDLTGVPDIYREVDIHRFNWDVYDMDMSMVRKVAFSLTNKYEAWRDENRGLYLWSKTAGSGKTYLSCCIGKSIMMRTQCRMRFISAPDYLNKVAESYNRDKSLPDPSQIYRECDVLILDDIGVQISKEWQMQELFRLIDTRVTKQRVTIYTSNYDPEKLNVDDRIKTRIAKTTMVIHMPEKSIRSIRANEEQAKFYQKMFGGNENGEN